jgi:4-amino-4-deoxy-L-arabinose transferase-like glycosyltransferase
VTPIVVAGLVALAVLGPPPALRWRALLLVGFVVGFALFLTVASKKLDRYALPLFPVLAILAGLGLWSLWRHVLELAGRFAMPVLDGPALVVLVGVVQALSLVWAHPYPLAYYNPLLGGGPAARRALLVGWGEGLDQVAAYLEAQPGADAARIAIYYPQVLNFQGLVRGTVQRYGDPRPADYVVDYVSAAQRGHTPAEVAGLAPRHTVRINGILYARVYQLTPPTPIGAHEPTTDD